jgi:multidrug efflux pump subunit AcrA (membrane-fusion protein)
LSGAPIGVNSGAFARVAFNRGERTTMLVPASSVLTRGGIVGLFVVGDDDVARYRMIRTGLMQGDKIEVQAGLELGEKVLVSSRQPARNGDHIMAGGQ